MIVRRSEGVIRDSPARWKDDEVGDGDTGPCGLGCQDSKNGRILKESLRSVSYSTGIKSCPDGGRGAHGLKGVYKYFPTYKGEMELHSGQVLL